MDKMRKGLLTVTERERRAWGGYLRQRLQIKLVMSQSRISERLLPGVRHWFWKKLRKSSLPLTPSERLVNGLPLLKGLLREVLLESAAASVLLLTSSVCVCVFCPMVTALEFKTLKNGHFPQLSVRLSQAFSCVFYWSISEVQAVLALECMRARI